MKVGLLRPCVIAFIASATSVSATEIPPAYERIAKRYAIPPALFFSVALQESGRSVRGRFLPWPWTLNIDNKPYYFASREEAEEALASAMSQARSEGRLGRVAVGLGQIYMPSHRKSFANDVQALDPTINLNYAAMLLASEYLWTAKKGTPDWVVAVGRYHSPGNQAAALTYRTQVMERCRRIDATCALLDSNYLAQTAGYTR